VCPDADDIRLTTAVRLVSSPARYTGMHHGAVDHFEPERDMMHGRSFWMRAAAFAAGGLVLMAACSGGSPPSSGGTPNASGSSSSPSAVAYSACVRAHGVPNYPDPDSQGQLAKGDAQQFGVSTAQFQSAQRACQPLLPTGGTFTQQFQQCVTAGDCPPAVVQQALTKQRAFARCLRAHGVPNFPDPQIGPNGAPFFPVSAAGLSRQYTHSSQFESKAQACEREVGGPVPVLMG
jgi:hypothetical protein